MRKSRGARRRRLGIAPLGSKAERAGGSRGGRLIERAPKYARVCVSCVQCSRPECGALAKLRVNTLARMKAAAAAARPTEHRARQRAQEGR